jgi:hypothetical protein
MNTNSRSNRFILCAALMSFLLPAGAFAEDDEDQPSAPPAPPAAEASVPAAPKVVPAAKQKESKPKPAATAQAKPKASAVKGDTAKGKIAPASSAAGKASPTHDLTAEKTAPAVAPASVPVSPDLAAPDGQPRAPAGLEQPMPPPPPPVTATPAKKSSSGGFFGRLFGAGKDKENTAKSSQAAMPPRPVMTRPAEASPPFAVQPQAAKDLDAKSVEIGKKISKHFDVKERMRGSFRGPMMVVAMKLRAENPGKADKVQAAVEAVLDQQVVKHEEAARKAKAEFFAENFTQDELKDVESFYDKPVGQKLIKMWALMLQREAMFGQQTASSDMKVLRESLIKEAKKQELNIPKALEE